MNETVVAVVSILAGILFFNVAMYLFWTFPKLPKDDPFEKLTDAGLKKWAERNHVDI